MIGSNGFSTFRLTESLAFFFISNADIETSNSEVDIKHKEINAPGLVIHPKSEYYREEIEKGLYYELCVDGKPIRKPVEPVFTHALFEPEPDGWKLIRVIAQATGMAFVLVLPNIVRHYMANAIPNSYQPELGYVTIKVLARPLVSSCFDVQLFRYRDAILTLDQTYPLEMTSRYIDRSDRHDQFEFKRRYFFCSDEDAAKHSEIDVEVFWEVIRH